MGLPKNLSSFIWHFARRKKGALLGLVCTASFWAVHLSLNSYMIKLLIDHLSEIPLDFKSLLYQLGPIAAGYLLLNFFASLIMRLYDWLVMKTFPPMKNEITVEMFDYVEAHSLHYFQQNFAGSLANKINDMAKGVPTLIDYLLDNFLSQILAVVIGAGTMYFVHPYFCLLLLSWTGVFLTISYLLSRRAELYARAFSESRSTIVGKIVDVMVNILNVKLFAREVYESRYLRKSLEEASSKDQSLRWYLLKMKLFYNFLTIGLIGGSLWVLIYERAAGRVSVGDFALILNILALLVDAVYYLANQIAPFSEQVGLCKQALTIVMGEHEVQDDAEAKPLIVTQGEIVFDHVRFAYRKGHYLFQDKSLVIRAGEKVGLVGSSGSGKSTLVNLILRFYDIEEGKIWIDGVDIRTVTQESLRSQIAFVPQDPYLFHRTLMENIRYGRVEATDEEVIEAAKKAHCDEFINKLPEKYHSMLGERGVKLSGGQRQRIAIARAFLKNAPILILDEATSALDSVTEHLVQESLELLMRGKTVLVIAHRLSTLFTMNRLLVFKDGKIVQQGTHDELAQIEGGPYAELWNLQAKEAIEERGGYVPSLPIRKARNTIYQKKRAAGLRQSAEN